MERVLEHSPDIIWRLVHGEAVLLNPGNGEYFGLNEVGSAIWGNLDGQRTLTEALSLALAEYDAPREVMEADAAELITELLQKGLVREKA